MMKKFISVLMAVLLIVALVSGCGTRSSSEDSSGGQVSEDKASSTEEKEISSTDDNKEGYTIGFLNPYIGNTWRAAFLADAEKAADRYKEQGKIKDFTIASSDNDVTKQLSQLDNMINNDVDAIIIEPTSVTALGPGIQKAQDNGILVVITTSAANYEGTVNVIHDSEKFARTNAEWLFSKLEDKGNIVNITGLAGNMADTLRIKESEKVFSEHPNIKVLASSPADWSATKAQSVMGTFLSSFKQIDGVLQQDVTALGVIRAYENAGIKMPPMTGDYTYGFLRKWAQTPELESFTYTMQAGVSADAIGVAIRLLDGKEFKEGILQPNPLDNSLVNSYMVEPPYIVTNKAEPDADWMDGFKFTKSIAVQETIELGKDKSDSDSLDGALTDEQLDSLFE